MQQYHEGTGLTICFTLTIDVQRKRKQRHIYDPMNSHPSLNYYIGLVLFIAVEIIFA